MKVRILPSAWDGLARIKYRVRADFGEDVAQRVTDQILNSLERLERFPDSGSMTPDPWLNNMGFRMVISDKRNVSIFRRVDEDICLYHRRYSHRIYEGIHRNDYRFAGHGYRIHTRFGAEARSIG